VIRQPVEHGERRGEVLPLTRTEFRLFYLLASNAGRVVSTARLAEYAAEARARRGTIRVRQSMARLRQKLGLPHSGTKAIVAHPGVGYQYTGVSTGASAVAFENTAA
jgi:DNA-binding response OmpR family regulator